MPVEIFFNLTCISIFLWLRKKKYFTYQHFHLYLIAYGAFRFLHEFLRATPKPFGGISGYQIISLGILAMGALEFLKRKKHLTSGGKVLPATP